MPRWHLYPVQMAWIDANVRQSADALIWNWLISGTNARAKNYSSLFTTNVNLSDV